MAKIKTGITLFSLGTPYLEGELDLEGVIHTAAEIGAEGYELVASQMNPGYPKGILWVLVHAVDKECQQFLPFHLCPETSSRSNQRIKAFLETYSFRPT